MKPIEHDTAIDWWDEPFEDAHDIQMRVREADRIIEERKMKITEELADQKVLEIFQEASKRDYENHKRDLALAPVYILSVPALVIILMMLEKL